jgi:hypothetical protein
MVEKGPDQPTDIILDKFTDADLRSWNKLSELLSLQTLSFLVGCSEKL